MSDAGLLAMIENVALAASNILMVLVPMPWRMKLTIGASIVAAAALATIHPMPFALLMTVRALVGAGFAAGQFIAVSASPSRTFGTANGILALMSGILLALSDFTEELGATRVVPGSHRWEHYKYPEDADTPSVPAVMPAGSAVLYTGKTVHGAGTNVTQHGWRRGLHMSFVLAWLTPEEASPVGVPWEIAKTYSERVQRMLGYVSPRHAPSMSPLNWLVDFKDVSQYLRSK